ncbi:MAG: amino acid adenylation domain-containing protein [Bacillota bacterium]
MNHRNKNNHRRGGIPLITDHILELLEQSTEKFPEKIAFSDEKEALTFLEFRKNARTVGNFLHNKLQECNAPIVVFVEREVKSLVAMQGILYSGNYYVPLHSKMSIARLHKIIEVLQPQLILYSQASESIAKQLLCRCENIETILANNTEMTDFSHLNNVLDIDPAYVIFTSGSTGTPKGIVVSHRSVMDFTKWLTHFCSYTSDEIFGNQASFYFDLSGKDVYQTLSLGATCHIFPQKLFAFPHLLLEKMNEQKVTALNWATSGFNLISTSGMLKKYPLETLKKITVGGEVLYGKHVNEWQANVPELEIYNLYGPTEVTIDCTALHLTKRYTDSETVPIGTACKNMQVFLLNSDHTPTKQGDIGEICARGMGVAHGYFADFDKTNAVFIQNPLNKNYRDIIYKTGDLAYENEDGEFVFATRKDGQIKKMGYRIELSEIETAVNSIEEIKEGICLFEKETEKITCVYSGDIDKKNLAKQLRDTLPKYMIPNIYVQLEALPYNANGKIDRVLLKEMVLDGKN